MIQNYIAKIFFLNKCQVSFHAVLHAYHSLNSYTSAEHQLSTNSNSFMTQLFNVKVVSNICVTVKNKNLLEKLLCGIISEFHVVVLLLYILKYYD